MFSRFDIFFFFLSCLSTIFLPVPFLYFLLFYFFLFYFIFFFIFFLFFFFFCQKVCRSRQFSGSYRLDYERHVFSGPPPSHDQKQEIALCVPRLKVAKDIIFGVLVNAIEYEWHCSFSFRHFSRQLSQLRMQQPRCFGNHAASRFLMFFGVFSSFRCLVV